MQHIMGGQRRRWAIYLFVKDLFCSSEDLRAYHGWAEKEVDWTTAGAGSVFPVRTLNEACTTQDMDIAAINKHNKLPMIIKDLICRR